MFGAEISLRAPVRSSRRLGGLKSAAHGRRIVQAELEDRECQRARVPAKTIRSRADCHGVGFRAGTGVPAARNFATK